MLQHVRLLRDVRIRIALTLGALALLAHGLILSDVWFPIRAIAALVWAGLVPGGLVVCLLLADDPALGFVEGGVLAVGLGYVSVALGTLALQALAGPLTRTRLLLFYDGVAYLLLVALMWRGPKRIEPRSIRREWGAALLVILLLAMGFRLPFLGHSDFRGDEARALIRAAEVLQGHDEVLLLHKKGPVEILIPAFCYAIGGRINEWVARLPFAWAGVTTALALAILGRRLFNARVGWLAGGLLAINGYSVGLARITQYQGAVFLSTILALFCTYRFYEVDEDRPEYLLLGTAFAVVGLLSHYDTAFALPVMAYLLWARVRREGRCAAVAVRWALPSLLLGLVILGGFYLPFLRHPHFERTSAYLSQRAGGQLLRSNLRDFFLRASEYCGTYYLLSYILALTAAVVIRLSSSHPFSNQRRLVGLWLSVPAVFYLFLVHKVQTHYDVLFPAWTLVVAVVLDGAWRRMRNRSLPRWISHSALALGAILYGLCGYYIYLAFLQREPEYIATYPQHKSPLFWMPYGDSAPRGGHFGFSHQLGWKAIGALYAQGILRGEYDSVGNKHVMHWYTRGQIYCPGADNFVLARDVFPHRIPTGLTNGEYGPAIQVWVSGQPRLWVWRRGYDGPVKDYQRPDLGAYFDRHLSKPLFRIPFDDVAAPSHPVQARLGPHFELMGGDMERDLVASSGEVLLTLYWRALEPTDADYHVFVHVGEGELIAQRDGIPCCGQHPTYRWERGEEVVDRYLLWIDEGAEDGVHPIRVGMYDVADGKRLAISDARGRSLGTSLLLTRLRVGEPRFEVPPIPHAQRLTLGDRAQLLGYTSSFSEETLELTLYWKCLAEMETDYTVFVHLLDAHGEIIGQRDGAPLDGRLPTTAWVRGEVIVDGYELPVGKLAGQHKLAIGLYDPATGERLGAFGAQGNRLEQDRVLLELVR